MKFFIVSAVLLNGASSVFATLNTDNIREIILHDCFQEVEDSGRNPHQNIAPMGELNPITTSTPVTPTLPSHEEDPVVSSLDGAENRFFFADHASSGAVSSASDGSEGDVSSLPRVFSPATYPPGEGGSYIERLGSFAPCIDGEILESSGLLQQTFHPSESSLDQGPLALRDHLLVDENPGMSTKKCCLIRFLQIGRRGQE